MKSKLVVIISSFLLIAALIVFYQYKQSISSQVNYQKVVDKVFNSEIEGAIISLFRVPSLSIDSDNDIILTTIVRNEKADSEKFKAGTELFRTISMMKGERANINIYKPGEYYEVFANVQFKEKKLFRETTEVYGIEFYINPENFNLYMNERYYDRRNGLQNINDSDFIEYKSNEKIISLIKVLFDGIKANFKS